MSGWFHSIWRTKIYTSNANIPTSYVESWHYVVERGLGTGDSGIPPPPPSDPDPLLSAPSVLSICTYSFSDNRTLFFSSFLAPGLLILSFFFFFSAWRTLPHNISREITHNFTFMHYLGSHIRASTLHVRTSAGHKTTTYIHVACHITNVP